jgi:hypothetical protein
LAKADAKAGTAFQGASLGQPTCLALRARTLPLVFASGIKEPVGRANYSNISSTFG